MNYGGWRESTGELREEAAMKGWLVEGVDADQGGESCSLASFAWSCVTWGSLTAGAGPRGCWAPAVRLPGREDFGA